MSIKWDGVIFQAKLLHYVSSVLCHGWQEGHPACKTEQWGAGMVVCLERGADLHMA